MDNSLTSVTGDRYDLHEFLLIPTPTPFVSCASTRDTRNLADKQSSGSVTQYDTRNIIEGQILASVRVAHL